MSIIIITFPEEKYRGFSIVKTSPYYMVFRNGSRQALWEDTSVRYCEHWIDRYLEGGEKDG